MMLPNDVVATAVPSSNCRPPDTTEADDHPRTVIGRCGRGSIDRADRRGEHVGMTTYADDLSPGQRIELGHHTLTEGDIVDFARLWDPIAIHAEPDVAAHGPFGGVIASGLQTLAVYQRLAVEALWSGFAGGIGKGFEIRFRRPVPVDTTLTGHITVRDVAARPERGDAEVTLDAELVNQDGDVVLELTNVSVLPLRPR